MAWLWRNDSSTSSFEKALSKLSSQIASATVSLERTRSTGRRFKALWTLYTSLAYIVTAIVLVLVIGPQDWTLPHYAGVIGMPFLIYGGRRGLTAVFEWRAGRQQAHLSRLQKERESKITDLKKATKYDSTQELLEKYGGASPKEKQSKDQKQDSRKKGNESQKQPQRTGLPPPPTANIPGNSPVYASQQSPNTPRQSPQQKSIYQQSPVSPEAPGFAPNAFPLTSAAQNIYEQTPHWYDRILDVLLGEDENLAKNRLVLLCQQCRQVNGQAPPGIKTLEELGKWRCANCRAWNGVESETAKVLKEAVMTSPSTASDKWQQVSHDEQEGQVDTPRDESATRETAVQVEGTTGVDHETNSGGITKRVTRSTGQVEAADL